MGKVKKEEFDVGEELLESVKEAEEISKPNKKKEESICDKCGYKFGSRVCKSCIEYGGN